MDSDVRKRRWQAAHISLMLMIIFKEMQKGYGHGKINNTLPELMVLFAITIYCRHDLPAIPISRLARFCDLPRPNVQRYVMRLIKNGAVVRAKGGVTLNAEYAARQTLTKPFDRIMRKIIIAGRELDKHWTSPADQNGHAQSGHAQTGHAQNDLARK